MATQGRGEWGGLWVGVLKPTAALALSGMGHAERRAPTNSRGESTVRADKTSLFCLSFLITHTEA